MIAPVMKLRGGPQAGGADCIGRLLLSPWQGGVSCRLDDYPARVGSMWKWGMFEHWLWTGRRKGKQQVMIFICV